MGSSQSTQRGPILCQRYTVTCHSNGQANFQFLSPTGQPERPGRYRFSASVNVNEVRIYGIMVNGNTTRNTFHVSMSETPTFRGSGYRELTMVRIGRLVIAVSSTTDREGKCHIVKGSRELLLVSRIVRSRLASGTWVRRLLLVKSAGELYQQLFIFSYHCAKQALRVQTMSQCLHSSEMSHCFCFCSRASSLQELYLSSRGAFSIFPNTFEPRGSNGMDFSYNTQCL